MIRMILTATTTTITITIFIITTIIPIIIQKGKALSLEFSRTRQMVGVSTGERESGRAGERERQIKPTDKTNI